MGIDHNRDSIQLARGRGLSAFTIAEFERSEFNRTGRFDSILFLHVADHMKRGKAVELLKNYLFLLKPAGRVVVITPQEAGFRSDPSHVEFMDFAKVNEILTDLRLEPMAAYSFPFSRLVGRAFKYNEFVVIGAKPGC